MTVTKFVEILPQDMDVRSACELWKMVKDSNLINEVCIEELRRSIKTIVGISKRVSLYGIEGTVALFHERGLEITEDDALYAILHRVQSLEPAAT